MSVEALQRGLGDLNQGLDRRDRRQKEEEKIALEQAETQRVRKAQTDLGDMLSGTTEGANTTQGQFLSQGVKSGLIDAKTVASELGDMQGKKLFYQIQAKIATEQDPVKKQKMMAMANEMTDAYARINAYEAYSNAKNQMIGVLEAKKQFGVLNPGKGKKKTDGSEPEEASSADLQVSLDDLPNQLKNFVDKDPFYQDYMYKDSTKGYLAVSSDSDDRASFQERLNDQVGGYLKQHPILGQQGMEVQRLKVQKQLVDTMALQGLDGFMGVGSSGEKMFGKTYTVPVSMSQEQAISIANTNRGKVDRTAKGIFKGAGVKSTNLKDKTPIVNTKNVSGDESFYLGQ